MTIKSFVAAALGTAFLTGCASLSQEPVGPDVISFDHGATDTLVALGFDEKIVAIPQTGLPEYLSGLSAGRPDAGNLKTPDLAVVRELAPDMVLVTGRQAESLEELQAITQVQDVSLLGDDYREAVQIRVLGLATLYGQLDEAGEKLDQLWRFVEEQRDGLAGSDPVAVVTHNQGKFSLRDEPVVFQLLNLEAPRVPEGVESVTRGTRVFTPVTPANLATMAPSHLFVVDRSAAIGDEPLDVDQLRRDLDAAGGGTIDVTVLSPELWYLSGGGLQSVRLQVEEVVDALR
ncbi:ABC transporter substrate-binding protein [Marinobacter sp. AN1]|uniref:ABC transporter substrate-binding protein n=1 Tax=Marinobacter sp. AN1 TaxID=2886046 RepID=UPI0022321ECA|nr:ABC transporter substrate-binding protein [Marinobacter sp. AN1]UZD66191.1 ABC transporter substrate-binding protein [Marinobacter sp. AN1]